MLKKIFQKLYALLWIVCALALGVCLFSYSGTDTCLNVVSDGPIKNYLGIVGAYVSDILLQSIGFSAVLLCLFVLIHGVFLLFNKERSLVWLKRLIGVFCIFMASFLLARYGNRGGFIGILCYKVIPPFHDSIYVLLWAGVVCGLIFCLDLPIITMSKWIYSYSIWFFKKYILRHKKVEKAPSFEKPIKTTPVQKEKTTQEKKTKTPVLKSVKNTGGFVLPPASLLDNPKAQGKELLTKDQMDEVSRKLESILMEFGVKGNVVRVSPGPVVTLYEFEPAAGIKTSRVIGLAEDLARAMSVISVRMAVLPGTSVIGIEMPNKVRQTVFIKEIVDADVFMQKEGALPLILGKDIAGNPVIEDLAKMPHLLVAGTTGSGKSVGINTMILSLLYRFTPEQCKLIMVDPKMLELSVYNGIPHLLTPVVTEPGKAIVALKWTVKEMDNRYRAMATMGVRNIDGYNKKIEEAIATGQKLTRQVQTGFDPETGHPVIETQEIDLKPLPYIVVIVDEMADLMLTAGKEVDIAVQRIAQKARASGIHLIMATQRPSVDVITGTIKANFPSRISFQVTSKIDSRTILGEQGAEQLLGRGDMLFMPSGKRPKRVHGPFVSDDEVERVVSYLKTQQEAEYNDEVMIDDEAMDGADGGAVFDKTSFGGSDGGDLYEQAVQVVLRDKKPSISYVQRQFRIGYNKAADLIDRMEREGIITAASPTGKREIIKQQGEV